MRALIATAVACFWVGAVVGVGMVAHWSLHFVCGLCVGMTLEVAVSVAQRARAMQAEVRHG